MAAPRKSAELVLAGGSRHSIRRAKADGRLTPDGKPAADGINLPRIKGQAIVPIGKRITPAKAREAILESFGTTGVLRISDDIAVGRAAALMVVCSRLDEELGVADYSKWKRLDEKQRAVKLRQWLDVMTRLEKALSDLGMSPAARNQLRLTAVQADSIVQKSLNMDDARARKFADG